MQNILIVDDTSVNLTLLYKILNKLDDVNVIGFKNGADAVESIKDTEYALAILDVDMPVMNGFELADKIRETSNMPIIFLTAVFNDESHEFKGYDAGAVDFLTKPIHQDILLCKVKIFIQIAKHSEEQQQLIKKLQNALDQINTLHGIIPICATCQKVRTVDGDWTQLEEYVKDHTDAEFSHGICPCCLEEGRNALEDNKNELD